MNISTQKTKPLATKNLISTKTLDTTPPAARTLSNSRAPNSRQNEQTKKKIKQKQTNKKKLRKQTESTKP